MALRSRPRALPGQSVPAAGVLSELGFLSILEVHEEQDLSVGELRLPSGKTAFLYFSLKLAGKLSSEQESQQFQGVDFCQVPNSRMVQGSIL